MKSKRVTVHPRSDGTPPSAAQPKLTDVGLLEQSQINLTTPLDEIPKYTNAAANARAKDPRASQFAISVYPAEKTGSIVQNVELERSTHNRDKDVEVLSADQLDKVRVVASGLQKTYPNGKVAVKDFTLAMVEGQITCLLGR